MARYLDSIAHPWSRLDIQTAITRNFTDARESIESTEGGKLWRSLKQLDDTLWIFQTNTTELLEEICIFGERSKNKNFWNQITSTDPHTRMVKKKLFHVTSSLMTLVDHARNFQKKIPVDNYDIKRQQTFSTLGLHNFLQDLRNFSTHWRIAEANWSINYDFQKHTREVNFTITKFELMEYKNWKKEAFDYIFQPPTDIDIYKVVHEYSEQVNAFYSWHKGAVIDTYSSELRQHFEYQRLHDGLKRYLNWNITLSHLPKDLNPYQYLDQYLTTYQIELLLTYEHRSNSQIDALVHMLGMDEFCDAQLRNKMGKLFRSCEQ
ncbi:hypothetical protein NM213_14790 [Pseudomonas lactis]|uniref:hypothetical protein n=1 Tax=Pseudomonas lactis TaxID=1615674 RepID=UPI00054C1CBE|nr:hypothetical protein [Pseudomonas lactis]MDR8371154.1 hypothetical protein [Pseudomonas lactis]